MQDEHKGSEVLSQEIELAKQHVMVGAKYHHYKSSDMTYEVIGLGFLEANDELCVIYQAQYGERLTFIRPLKIWLETVDWQGQKVQRFTRI